VTANLATKNLVDKKIPVNLITGTLGSGKTTFIQELLAQKPRHEFWAILINEFGEIGIDAEIVNDSNANIAIKDIPGGCICCSAKLTLKVSLTELIRNHRPDRLIIEPTGLGHPEKIIDIVQDEDLSKVLTLNSNICLLDPIQQTPCSINQSLIQKDTALLADVVLINKVESASTESVKALTDFAEGLYPAKPIIAQRKRGEVQAEWLEEHHNTQSSGSFAAPSHNHSHTHIHKHHTHDNDILSMGQVFSAETIFDWKKLVEVFEGLPKDSVVRAKGAFRVGKMWQLYQWVGDNLTREPIAHRRDSRNEVLYRYSLNESALEGLQEQIELAINSS